MGQTRSALRSTRAMYDAAERWRDESLVGDRSLFAATEFDTLSAVRQLIEAFVEQPDAGIGTFISKLRSQLRDVESDAVQMAAELLYVHFLVSSTDAMRGETKREKVNQVVAFREQGTVRIPEDLERALFAGVANAGTAYNTYRWKMFGYLIRLVERFKSTTRDERQAAVGSLEAFRRFTADLDVQSAWTQQFALEHLLFPDEAPPVLSRDDRARIIAAFGPELGQTTLEGIAAALEPNVEFAGRRGVNFYRTPVLEAWQGRSEKLDTYTEWARLMLAREDFEQEEVRWKMERAVEIRSASAAIIQGADPGDHLKKIFRTADFVDFRVADDFMTWCAEHPGGLRAGLAALHAEPEPSGIDAFLAHVPEDEFRTPGARLSVASLLLFAVAPESMPPWRSEASTITARLTQGYTHQQGASLGEQYLIFLDRLDAIVNALRDTAGLDVNRLQAQGVAWLIAKTTHVPGWSEAMKQAFLEWRQGKATGSPRTVTEGTAEAEDVEDEPTDPTLEDLARDLHFDDAGTEWLAETVELLLSKRQLILQGPPGTGKTHIARELARFVANDGQVLLTQFHPGTAYEDFIQGLRPDPQNPSAFTLVDGPFLRAARSAQEHPERTVVVIIDEINRANIPAVFGELYFLLEYRDHDITLNYGGTFRLPKNLLVIGTMNTADRSITDLDAALRRRFFIRDLRPGEAPVDGMLRTFLDAEDRQPWLADLLEAANDLIPDRDQHIGPSHLMGSDESDARRAWAHSVLPTLQELYYNRPDKWADFDFDTLKGRVRGIASDAATD